MTTEQQIAYYLGYSLDHYHVADIDESTVGPNYFGFLDKEANFYIIKITISGNTQTVRYIRSKGLESYQTLWADRANLTYKYPSEIL